MSHPLLRHITTTKRRGTISELSGPFCRSILKHFKHLGLRGHSCATLQTRGGKPAETLLNQPTNSRFEYQHFEDSYRTSREGTLFPWPARSGSAISENTISVALRTLGFAKEEMSADGFRALASMLLHERSEFSTDLIERSLAHQHTNAIWRAYARGQHWDERVKLTQWWADYLDALFVKVAGHAA